MLARTAYEPLDRILDADRQVEEHEAELVAELVRLLHRPQVDRHQRAQHHAGDVVALVDEVARATRPRRRTAATSFTDAPSARPIAFTSVSGSGSVHATRLPTPGLPLKRVGESCGISASFASSAVSAVPCPASATRLAGSDHSSDALLDQRRPDLARGAHDARQRRQQLAQRVVGRVGALARLRRERHRRRAVGRRVRHRQHDAHQRDAVGVAVVDAHDERAAAVVVVDQVELPHRARGIERRASRAATRAPAVPCGPRGPAAPCGRRAARCRSACRSARTRPPAVSMARCLNRRNTRKRSAITFRRRASDTRSRNSSTPQIIIRFCGLSMRSHAVSTADIFSRFGWSRPWSTDGRDGGRGVARVFAFALK